MANSQNNNPYRQPGATLDESRFFGGVDLWTNPADQSGGMLLQADNVVNRNGMLYVRPGMVGMFGGTAPSSSSASPVSSSSSEYYEVGGTYYSVPTGPLYGLCDFVDASGYTWMLIADGNGRLYKTLQGSGSYTELLDTTGSHYSFTAAITDAKVLGEFAYIVDSSHALTRVDLTGGFPVYAMQAPSKSPTSALANGFLFQANSASNWSFDGQAAAYGNLFASLGNINGAGNTWTSGNIGGASTGGDYINLIGTGAYLTLPGAGAGDSAGGLIAVPALSPGPSGTTLYPSRFHVLMNTIKDTGSGSASVNVVITPFNSSSIQLGASIIQNVSPSLTLQQSDLIFDFSGLGPNVAKIKFTVINAAGTHGNMFIETPSLYPISVQTAIVSGATQTTFIPSISGGAINLVSSSSSSSMSAVSSSSPSGGGVSSSATDLGTILDYQGTSLIFTFPSDSSSSSAVPTSGYSSSSSSRSPYSSSSYVQTTNGIDLSTTDRLVIGLGGVSSWVGVQWNLYLQQWNGTWLLADNGAFISEDQTGLDCDISTLTTAQLSNITALKLTFQTNVTWASPFYALRLGPITTPGNLSVGLADYQYYMREDAVIDSSNTVSSNPSLPSALITPTFSQAEATVKLPSVCPVNTPETNQYTWARLGGVYSDVRVIASVSKTVSVAYGSDPNNPYYGWDATTGTFTDNTPDIFLALAPLISFSNDPMPSNAQCLAVFNGRLWLAEENVVSASWLYNSNNSAPLMTTLVSNIDDPDYPIQGASFPISSDPSDTIVRMIPYGTPIYAGNQYGGGLLILCKRSVWMVQGTDASNFTVQQYPYAEGVGLVAFRGVARSWNNQVIFMGPDRLHQFPPQHDDPRHDMGLPIKPQLYPVTPQTLQDSTAFSKSWLAFHDSKILVGCPQPGQSANSVIWIYDELVPGWLRWTGPSDAFASSSSGGHSSSSSMSSGGPNFNINGMAITGAMSLPPNSNGADYDLYLFGINGQMFRMFGSMDQDTPTSYPQPIPVTVQVHAMRPGFYVRYKQRPLFYVRARLEWVEIELVLTGTVVMTAQAYTAGIDTPTPISGAKTIQSYQLANLGRPFTLNCPPGLIEGDLVTVTLSFVASSPAYLRGVRGFVSGTSTEHG